ncbi:abortive infection protein [Secundilactobacillus pentosiphilus]|uniref:Abortive infection protein n=1 Tax=Secundilactobacillus pentosiphilus TaxID=1714682 RepID=A0A1Z5IQ43_9LACO|nr:CPBP family intramembrane glutamic endopeptidase [Secundilactobacillus pentosiphilus]GAX03738.1 abortive infection protein [Secundilactobacillus pentosiphilus]
MKYRAALLSAGTVVMTIIVVTLASIVGHLISMTVPIMSKMGVQIITEVLALVCWWGLNHWYPKANVSWWHHGVRHQWALILPVLLVLIGDSTLKPTFHLTLEHVVSAVLVGFSVGLFEEYVFRGVLVSGLRQRYRVGPLMTAFLSGLMFSLVHLVNATGNGSVTMTLVQMLEAIGLGFFFAAIYLVTGSLWLPIVAHGVIDAFDALAFGTLSNTAGMSIWTSLVYTVVFGAIGCWLIKSQQFTVKISTGNTAELHFQRQPRESRPAIEAQAIPVGKTIIAGLIPLAELGLGALVTAVFTDKWLRIILVDVIFFAGFCMALYLYHDLLADHWRRFKPHLGAGTLVAVGGVLAAYVVLIAVRQVLQTVGVASAGGFPVMSIQSAGMALVASLTTLMAPFTEEIIFRHALFYQWRGRGTLTWIMLMISSVAFGLVHWNNFHGQLAQMVPYMCVGVLFGLIYYFSRNIWQTIYTHFLFDIIQVIAVIAMFILAIVQ